MSFLGDEHDFLGIIPPELPEKGERQGEGE
jgi:hypothetical protein